MNGVLIDRYDRIVHVTTRKLASVALVGPPLFAVTAVVLTALKWDFLHDLGWSAGLSDSPDTPWPSSLMLGEYGFVQILSFLMLGCAVLALAIVLFRLLGARRETGPTLLVLLAAGLAASAFRTDYGTGTGAGPETWNGAVHAAGLTVVVPAALASMVVLAVRFRRDERWRRLSRFSAVAAVVALASLVAALAGLGNVFAVFLAAVLVWLTRVAAHTLSVARRQA